MSKPRLILTLATLAVIALATTATTANAALPSVLLLTGSNAKITAESSTQTWEFHGSVIIKGTGYKFELNVGAAMTSLGTGSLWLLNAEASGAKCNTVGDTAGNILTPVQWHTVLAFSGGGSELFLILILVAPTDWDCGTTLFVLSGSLLTDAEKFGRQATSLTASTGACTGTTPFYKTYVNDKSESVTAALKAEIAEIKGAACEEINGGNAFTFTASEMLEIMEP